MKLYILSAREDLKDGDNPWDPWYDKMFNIVVRAETEIEARKIAQKDSADESRGEFLGGKISNTTAPWLDSKYSICDELTSNGESGTIIVDVSQA